MCRIGILSILIFFSFLSLPDSFAQSLKDLIDNPELFDKQQVEIEAEALDVLKVEGGSWINVSDGDSSLGVWVEKGKATPAIENFGSYKEDGDLLKIKGIFNSSCQVHLGERDVHAEEVTIIKKGAPLREEITPNKRKLLAFWFSSCVFLCIIFLIKILLTRIRGQNIA